MVSVQPASRDLQRSSPSELPTHSSTRQLMHIIGKKFTFAASHQLWRDDWDVNKNREIFGKCSRLHGHNYYVEIEVRGIVDKMDGMVINYYDLGRVINKLDHRHLNEIMDMLPTAENLSTYVAMAVENEARGRAEVVRVLIKETESSFAVYSPLL